jgi:hypothetical protein
MYEVGLEERADVDSPRGWMCAACTKKLSGL